MDFSDLLGFGHCCADYLAVLDPFPPKGMKGDVVESVIVGGGPVPTACQTVAKFGLSARFIGKVGDDFDGRVVLQGLTEAGVDGSFMLIDPEVKTARAYIWIDRADGSRTVALDTVGSQFPREEEFDLRLISRCRFLLIDGRPVEADIAGLHEAKRLGVTTMLDAGATRPRIEEMLPMLDYAVVSHSFADTYAPGAGPKELVDRLIEAGAGTAIVTDGEKGAWWSSGSRSGLVPGFHVTPVVDTTGAGDVFHGGLIYGLLKGWELEEAIRMGNAAAALSVRKLSGRGGIPELKEARRLMDDG
jgi:ribokinase